MYCTMTFIISYVIVVFFFFYTHILINMYICCFFKLPHCFDFSHRFICIIWDEIEITKRVLELSSHINMGEVLKCFYILNGFLHSCSSIVLPPLYIKMFFSHLFVVGAPF